MRPIDFVERRPNAVDRRKQRRWRVFFVCLVIGQLIAFNAIGTGFWPVVLASAAAFGLHAVFWAVFDRRR